MDRHSWDRRLDDLKTDVLELESEVREATAGTRRQINRADTLQEFLAEGLKATLAFEHYCKTYRNHELSPRLKKWIEVVRAATGMTITYEEMVAGCDPNRLKPNRTPSQGC